MDNIEATMLRLQEAITLFFKTEWRQRRIKDHKPSEIRILICILKGTADRDTKLKISDISKMLYVTTPTVTQLIKNLSKDGLVSRTVDPIDRRVTTIELTEKGRQLAEESIAILQDSFRNLVSRLGTEKSELLASLLTEAHQISSENN